MLAGSIAGITPGAGGTGEIEGLRGPGCGKDVGSSIDIAGMVDAAEEEEDGAREFVVVAKAKDGTITAGPPLIGNR